MLDGAALWGSWRLVSAEVVRDGEVVDAAPFGREPSGVLHYLSDGRMAALIAHEGRPPLPGGRTGAPAADRLEAARTFTAYAGSFEVEGDTVVHHVEINSHPNDVGVDYRRQARLEGDELELRTPPDLPPDQRPMRLRWRRMKEVPR